MKLHAFLALSVLLFVSSCGDSSISKKPVKLDEEVSDVQPWKDIVGEYETFVKGLNKRNISSSTVAMKKYKRLFKDADKATCDSGFVVFHELYESLIRSENESVYNDVKLQNTVWNQTDENGKSEPMPKVFKDLENKIKPHGYRLEFPEGMISIGYDRSFIAKHFYKYVSPVMRTFLKELDHENETGFSEDGGITIDEEEYVERLVWYENFEKKNPEFIMAETVKYNRKYLFTFFLIGMDNTPVYWPNEENTIVVEDYFNGAYTLLQQKYPNSETWKRTKPFKQALLASDTSKMKKLLSDYQKKGWMMDFAKDFETI